jgi:hypothetical protein
MLKRTSFAIGAATSLALLSAGAALGADFNPWNNNNVYMKSMTDNWSAPSALGSLANNEGIYVNTKNFKIAEGTAKGEPAERLKKSGAKQVADGAIIFRSGNKLYIVDGKPPSKK